MALQNIQAIWSSQVLVALRAAIVYGSPLVTNRNYQGEIRQAGDRVRVTGIVDPTIFDITPNTDIPAPETLTDTAAEMVIDRNKGFNFQVDDLDQLRNAVGGLRLRSAANAATRMAEVADAGIAAKMVTEAESRIGSAGAPIRIDAPQPGQPLAAGTIDTYRLLVMLGIKLDRRNVPALGRWVVLPSFMMGALALDTRFTAAPGDNQDTLRNGFHGRAANFMVFTTSAVPFSAGKYSVLAGSNIATSYAEQLVQVKFYEPERRFANAAKGQHVYGHRTFYPQALALATVEDASGLDA